MISYMVSHQSPRILHADKYRRQFKHFLSVVSPCCCAHLSGVHFERPAITNQHIGPLDLAPTFKLAMNLKAEEPVVASRAAPGLSRQAE
jgi:hypothetical protein